MILVRLILILIALPVFLIGAESDSAKFMAKDKENTLKITSYQKNKLSEQQQKQLELEEQAKKNEIKKLKAQEKLINSQKESPYEKQLRLEREALEQANTEEQERLRKLVEQKRLADEARAKRVSKVKLVKSTDLDIVHLNYDEYQLDSYEELGIAEDASSSAVNKENLLTTDMYVRLLLETNINSRRATEFTAVVEKDVYSFHSKNVILPKGSKFVCEFEPLSAYGETSIKSSCSRIHLPNGKSVLITNGDLKDGMGRGGLSGYVDNRMWEKYGQTFMLSIFSGMAIMGADQLPTTSIASLAQYSALNVLDLSSQILEKTIQLAPVVTVSSGTRLIFKPTVDINMAETIKNS